MILFQILSYIFINIYLIGVEAKAKKTNVFNVAIECMGLCVRMNGMSDNVNRYRIVFISGRITHTHTTHSLNRSLAFR